MVDTLGAALILAGLGFFLTGSIGILRFPDLYSRLHALTKADNLGLGLLVLGILLLNWEVLTAVKLFLVWVLVLASSAGSTYLIAKRTRRRERVR